MRLAKPKPVSARPRICWILDDTDRSGDTARLHAVLGEETLARRFDRHVISLAPPGAMAIEIQSAGAALHAAHEVHGEWGLARSGATLLRTMHLLKGLRPDVVHATGAAAALIGTAAARLAGVPRVVASPHGEQRTPELVRLTLSWALRSADLVLGATQAHAQLLASRHGITEGKLRVSGLLAATHRCAHQVVIPELAGGPRLVSLLRFHPQENLMWVLDSIEILRRFHPGVCWTIFGRGVAGAPLLAAARARGLEAALRIPGETDDPLGALLAADIFVQPRRTEHPLQALLEAMHAGRPIVSVDGPGVSAVMEDGREGLIVPHAPPSLLADAVDRLLMSKPLREDCARRAQERAHVSWRAARCAEEWAGFYSELAGRALSFAV